MTKRKIWATAIVTLTCVFSLGAAAVDKPTITVLAAISLREAMTDVKRDFEASHDATVEFVFGASGQLASQIETGAPADVFVSAADTQVNKLAEKKLVDPATRTLVAHNMLVLIVPAAAKESITKFEELSSEQVRLLAVGEPKSVPAGMYAKQVLGHLQLEQAVANKLVLGANVKQVLDYVARGEAEAGLVYLTDAMAASKDVKIVAQADPSWHESINYPAVVVSGSKQPALAAEFVAALTSETGRTALNKQGFALPAPATRPAK
jgi:molybdate transport system substrate-binding protein